MSICMLMQMAMHMPIRIYIPHSELDFAGLTYDALNRSMLRQSELPAISCFDEVLLIHICVHACSCAHPHARTHARTNTRTHTRTHARMQARTHVSEHVSNHTSKHRCHHTPSRV